MVKKSHPLPRTRRCELLAFPRSTSYYWPKSVSDADLALMKRIDPIHLAKPFLGSRRIVDALARISHETIEKGCYSWHNTCAIKKL
jgi:putative transposase